MFLRTPFNYDTNKASDRTGLYCPEPTLTQQHFKDECDINLLFARYLDSGEMPQVTDGLSYGDFTGIFDFQTAMNAVRTAEGMFQQLPARIKNRFENDPQKLLTFLNNPENRDEAEFLGILRKPDTLRPGNNALTGDDNDPGTKGLPASGTQTQPRPAGTQASPPTADGTQKP